MSQIAWNLLQTNEIQVTLTARNDTRKLTNVEIIPEQKFTLTNEDYFNQVLKFWCENNEVSKMELASVVLFFIGSKYPNIDETFFSKTPSEVQLTKKDYDRKTNYSLPNFQASLYFIKVLNMLQNEDYQDFFPMKRWSGIQIHNVIRRFSNVSCLLEELTHEKQRLEFQEIFQKFETLTSSKLNIELPKKKASKKQVKSSSQKDCSTEFTSKSTIQKVEDLNNRFQVLTLDIE